MAQYEGITYTRQDAFRVEPDLLCRPFDMQVGESAAKIVYHLYNDAALVGEFVISDAGRREIIREAQRVLELLCTNKGVRLSLMDGRMLAVACVLLTRNMICAEGDKKSSHQSKIWQYILDGLNFPQISEKTGCSEPVVLRYLYDNLKNRNCIRFFTEGGNQYYNTLRIHALSPEQPIRNLYNVLYGFYHKNLECSYDPGTNVASMFVSGIRRRWENTPVSRAEQQNLQSDQLSSGLRELFMVRPNYMAAVCDALLEKIDRIVQGDFTTLSDHSRWDVLLKEWYDCKTAFERNRMHNDRKAAVKGKVVDRKEYIRAEYQYENGDIYLSIPGIRLPDIQQPPLLQLYHNGQLIWQRNLSIYGDDILRSTRPCRIPLNQIKELNWKKKFNFEVRILSGESDLYCSGSDLYREFLCFSPAGNETRPIRCSQMLHLIVNKSARVVIDDPENNYSEEAGSYRSFGLWTESIRSITVNREEILEQPVGAASQQISPYLTPGSDPAVTAKFQDKTVAVYAARPILHVPVPEQADAKNYQLIINGSASQLYQYPWDNGQFRIPLPPLMDRVHQVQVKDFATGKIIFQRSYTIVPGLTYEFDQRFYLDKPNRGKLSVKADRRQITHSFELQPGENCTSWEMAGITYEINVPKVTAEINGRNAFYLPPKLWYEELKDSFLSIRGPAGFRCTVVVGNKFLTANSAGNYEIGAAIDGMHAHADNAVLGLLMNRNDYHLQWELTDIHFRESFTTCPVLQNGRQILWDPVEAGYMGSIDKPQFCLYLDNDQQKDPFYYTLSLKPDTIERNFPCGPGTYNYTLYLVNRKKMFSKLPDLRLLSGEITLEASPEDRFYRKNIRLTQVYYNDPVTGADVSNPLRGIGLLIKDIRYEGLREVNGKEQHEYSGILYAPSDRGWQRCYETETKEHEKINPIFFVLEDAEHLYIYHDDDASLMLNLKAWTYTPRNKPPLNPTGPTLYQRKDELSQNMQHIFLAFADKFQFVEEKF